MARVNVEQKALTDARYAVLGNLIGTDRHGALGRMILVWNECQERETHILSEAIVNAIFERDDAAELIIRSELASLNYSSCSKPVQPGKIRIRGCAGRTDWLKKRRKDGQKGGRPPSKTCKTLGLDKKHPSANPLTLTPAPAPTPAQREKTQTPSPTVERSAVCVPGGFARFWKAYPRKVGKRAAEASWKRQKLEPQADQIIEAVRRQSAGEDWTKDGGQYVPHPTTWLTQGRWDDETTTPEAAIPFIPDSEWYRKHGLKGRP